MDNLIIDLFYKNIITFNNDIINCNFKEIFAYPYLINIICNLINDKLKFLEYNSIIGINNLSIHISSILSYKNNMSILMFSKKNNRRVIYGNINDDINIILLNDIINDGLSIIKYMNLLKSNKINISKILVIYSNNTNNIENIISLFDKFYVINLLQSKNKIKYSLNTSDKTLNIVKNLIKQKQTHIGFDCNLTNIKDIISEVDNIGSKIIFLKICSNKIDDFTIRYGNALNKLAINHKFFIIDDLGIYNKNHNKIDNWCNFITTYNYNIEFDSNLNFIYYNNDKEIINSNMFGNITNKIIPNTFNISNTVNDRHSLKNIILSKFDIVMIDNNFCNNQIIEFINKNYII